MAVRDGVGINELQNFGKYLVRGAGARAWLDRIMAGRIPKPGRLSLTPMLAHSGKIIGDFTVSCLSGNRIPADRQLWRARLALPLVRTERDGRA